MISITLFLFFLSGFVLPRIKQFNEQQVLEEIGHLFWREGYSSVSMDQISSHTSLTKTSIYNAYGDKASLFKKVVDWYVADVLSDGITAMETGHTASEKVAALLSFFLVQPDTRIISRGCLLTSNLVEIQYSEPELFDYLCQKMDQISTTIHSFLSDEQKSERLRADADPAELADYVMTVLQGLRVRSRTTSKPIDFGRAIEIAMAPIESAEQTTTGKQLRVH